MILAKFSLAYEGEVKTRLDTLYACAKKVAPDAVERMTYGMPTFWKGKNLFHYNVYKKHIGFYPGPETISFFASQLSRYKVSKGAVQFKHQEAMPYDLIEAMMAHSTKLHAKN